MTKELIHDTAKQLFHEVIDESGSRQVCDNAVSVCVEP